MVEPPAIRQRRRGLSDRRRGLRHESAEFQRRRRRFGALQRPVAADGPGRFPGAQQRRRRRRLAADLCGTAAVLRRDRPPVRGLRAGRQPGVSRRRRAAASGAADRARSGSPSRVRTAGWDGTGGPTRTRSCRRRATGGTPACSAAPAAAAATKARRPRRISRTGRSSTRLGGALVTRATVRRILVDSSDRATGVEWVDADGGVHEHEADVVLCAANGIGTPRLLLASATADASRRAGQRLRSGRPRADAASDDPRAGHASGRRALARAQRRPDQLAAVLRDRRLTRLRARCPLGADRRRPAARARPWPHGGMGAGASRRMREQVGRRLQWVLLAEDLPEDHNRVTLGDRRRPRGPGRGRRSATAPARTPSACWPGTPSAPANPWRRPAPSTSGSSGRAPTATSWAPRGWATIPRLRSAIAGDSPTGSAISASSTAASSRRRAA